MKIVQDEPHDWDQKLISALWAYRTTFKVTTNQTPFRLAYGQVGCAAGVYGS